MQGPHNPTLPLVYSRSRAKARVCLDKSSSLVPTDLSFPRGWRGVSLTGWVGPRVELFVGKIQGADKYHPGNLAKKRGVVGAPGGEVAG